LKSVLQAIGAALIVLLIPAIMISLDSFRLTDQEEPHNVTTGASVTSANLTLAQDLYNDDTVNASVTSNLTSDAPVPSTYTASTNVLLVTGLDDSATRQLTVTYSVDALTDYWGAALGSRTIPLFIILAALGIIGGSVYQAYSRNN